MNKKLDEKYSVFDVHIRVAIDTSIDKPEEVRIKNDYSKSILVYSILISQKFTYSQKYNYSINVSIF